MTRGPLTPHTVLYAEKKKSCENKTSLENVMKNIVGFTRKAQVNIVAWRTIVSCSVVGYFQIVFLD